jgi:hypothetical protein
VTPPVPPTSAGQEAPASPPDELDPWNLDNFRQRQSLAAAAGVKKHLTELPVRTPDKSWWVRRHPDPEYCLDTWVIELKEEREVYLVDSSLWPELQGEACFRHMAFYLATTMQGKLFFWGIRLPADDTLEPDRWMRTPLEAVRLAKDQWTRITWNDEVKQHQVQTSDSTVEPEWPNRTLQELVQLAFKQFRIRTSDHPTIRRLRGQVS